FERRNRWTFTRGAAYALSGYPAFVQTGDLNADGILDLVVAAEASHIPAAPLSIFLGKGDGTFGARQLFSPLPGYQVYNLGPCLMDFNGDGLLDILSVGAHLTLPGPLILDANPGVRPNPGLGFLVKVQAATGVPLVLEHTTNFMKWTGLATNTAPTNVWPVVDPNTNSAARFYRTRQP
ncbi:MAG TPA: VCBS repeat-containing protein, partial [Candidatus Dormibacteraeota bacterium]|nr:VCBS repeat-containing protein [Candidatus Dormibacteraeota bacterium]